MISVNDFEKMKENSKVIIRTHGEEKNIYESLKKKKIQIIDLTCVKVKAIHDLIEKHSFVVIIAQTTFNDELFDKLVDIISNKCQKLEIKIYKTVCNVTKIRQKEIKSLAKKVDKMIIVGDKSSSNTKELVQVAKENCREVYLVQNIDDLKNISFDKEDIIGIGSGASTPIEIITDVKKYLQSRIKAL